MEKEVKLPYEVSYESDVRGSYLVLKVNQEEDVYDYQVEMMMNNDIPSLLDFNLRQKDIYKFLYYNITSKLQLSNLLERKRLKKVELLEMLIETLQGILAGGNYLLNHDGYIIQEDFIFIHPETLQISLLYIPCPMNNKDLGQELRRLVNRLILAVDPSEESSDNLLLKILYEMNMETFNIEGFLAFLWELKGEILREGTRITDGGPQASQKDLPKTPQKEQMIFDKGKIDIVKDNKKNIKNIKNDIKDNIKKDKKELKKQKVVSREIESVEEVGYTSRTKLMILLSETLILISVALIFLETTILKNPATGQIDGVSVVGILILVAVINYLLFKKIFIKEAIVVEKEVESVFHHQDSVHVIEDKENMDQNRGFYGENLDTVLLVSDDGRPRLISLQSGMTEKKSIDRDLFLIGKLKEQVDYVVSKKTVSRVHAEIRYVDGDYFLKDLNSRNGTYLNGERIQSNIDIPLKNDDRVAFADVEYIFSFEEVHCS